jgi:hypothetical protein
MSDEHSVVCGRETRVERVEVSFNEGSGDPLSRLWASLPTGGWIEIAKRVDERGRVWAVPKIHRPGWYAEEGPLQPTETTDGEPLSDYAVMTLALLGLEAEERRKGRL